MCVSLALIQGSVLALHAGNLPSIVMVGESLDTVVQLSGLCLSLLRNVCNIGADLAVEVLALFHLSAGLSVVVLPPPLLLHIKDPMAQKPGRKSK